MIIHRQGEVIRDPKGTRERNRYQIVTTIGTGGMATTYAAVDLANSQRVALKVLSFEQANDWKALEMFEREAKVLANLDHPFIPRYLDYFELDLDNDRRFYLVQELVEGESLATLIERNWQPSEAEVKDIALQLLDILVYLHSLSPPVIHRDIKPQNIIRNRQGQIYLVDFGAVQAVYRNTISVGGTFVGTLGYMSPEQLRGKVVTPSDLYSLGCSLIFLLTRKLPTDLPQKRMKLDFRDRVDISPHFADWLDRMIAPAIADRFDSVSIALTALKSKRANIRLTANTSAIDRSISPRISLSRQTDNDVRIKITSRATGCGHYFWMVFGMIWGLSFLNLFVRTGQVMPAMIGFISFVIVVRAIVSIWYIAVRKTILEIDPQYFSLQRTGFSLRQGLIIKEIKGFTADIAWVNLNIDKDRNSIINTCAIFEGDRQHKFGNGYNLSLTEAEKVTQEISTFLRQLRS